VHTNGEIEYVWDPLKAAANLRKHKVRFADAALSLEDPRAWVIADPDAIDEERFICLGADPAGQVLVTAFTLRGTAVRIISAREASRMERHFYESPR
jgi:uncharacterized DUF497 family protein